MSQSANPPVSPVPPADAATIPPSVSAPAPYVPPPSEAPHKEIVKLRLSDPFRWLALGWRDLLAAKGIGIFYDVCFLAMALVLGAVFRSKSEYALSIASGCLLVGPFLAMGLEAVADLQADLAQALLAC